MGPELAASHHLSAMSADVKENKSSRYCMSMPCTQVNTSADAAIEGDAKEGHDKLCSFGRQKGRIRNLHVHAVDEGRKINQGSNGRAGISQSIQNM